MGSRERWGKRGFRFKREIRESFKFGEGNGGQHQEEKERLVEMGAGQTRFVDSERGGTRDLHFSGMGRKVLEYLAMKRDEEGLRATRLLWGSGW